MTFFDDNLVKKCVSLVKKWKPKLMYDSELKYRDDLANFLVKNLNKEENNSEIIKIKKEASGSRCDIGVFGNNKQICIELKRNIKNKSKINRLQGQIDDYITDGFNDIIIVLINENLDVVDINNIKCAIKKKEQEINYIKQNFINNKHHIEFIKKIINKRKNKLKNINKKIKTKKKTSLSTIFFKSGNKNKSDWSISKNNKYI